MSGGYPAKVPIEPPIEETVVSVTYQACMKRQTPQSTPGLVGYFTEWVEAETIDALREMVTAFKSRGFMQWGPIERVTVSTVTRTEIVR